MSIPVVEAAPQKGTEAAENQVSLEEKDLDIARKKNEEEMALLKVPFNKWMQRPFGSRILLRV